MAERPRTWTITGDKVDDYLDEQTACIELEPVLDLLEAGRAALQAMDDRITAEWGAGDDEPQIAEFAALLREHGRLQ